MSDAVHRQLCRCTKCRQWWSIHPDDMRIGVEASCPCGGELELVDIEAHMATLPYSPFDPTKK